MDVIEEFVRQAEDGVSDREINDTIAGLVGWRNAGKHCLLNHVPNILETARGRFLHASRAKDAAEKTDAD